MSISEGAKIFFIIIKLPITISSKLNSYFFSFLICECELNFSYVHINLVNHFLHEIVHCSVHLQDDDTYKMKRSL